MSIRVDNLVGKKYMWKTIAGVSAGLLLTMNVAASEGESADLELSLSAGTSTLEPNVASPLRITDDSDRVTQISAGTGDIGPWAFQFRHVRFGEAQVSEVASVRYKALVAAVRYTHALTDRYSVSALAGPASVSADSRLLSIEDSTSTELFVGAGVNLSVDKTWTIRLEASRYGEQASAAVVGLSAAF